MTTTLLLAHGGSAGLLVEGLFLAVPAAILGIFTLVSRRRQRQPGPVRPEVEDAEADR